jgi:hypothetical protein
MASHTMFFDNILRSYYPYIKLLLSNSQVKDLPIVRKIISVGKTSKAVIIPKSWLDYFESEAGKPIENVAIEVNRVLKITPIVPKEG